MVERSYDRLESRCQLSGNNMCGVGVREAEDTITKAGRSGNSISRTTTTKTAQHLTGYSLKLSYRISQTFREFRLAPHHIH